MASDALEAAALHLDLDGAWPHGGLAIPRMDLSAWGPRVRYIARRRDVEALWNEIEGHVPKLLLYGSGDFHHLAGMLIRRAGGAPFTLVSFDNHPDWDVRPPYWSCGGWAARALRQPGVERISVWGCGNFELRFPGRLFADRTALRAGTFEVHAWAERQPASVAARFHCMTRGNWRGRFEEFVQRLRGGNVYVTVDMDCLRAGAAVTNWENGLFEPEEVAWAIGRLGQACRMVGADVCGAYSPPRYERPGQRLAAKWDHPPLCEINLDEARRVNIASLEKIWEPLAASLGLSAAGGPP